MALLTPDKINDIAQDLDCGFVCYINIQTGQHISILNSYDLDDTGAWDDLIAEVENNQKLYLQIGPLDTADSFRIMETFIYSLPN